MTTAMIFFSSLDPDKLVYYIKLCLEFGLIFFIIYWILYFLRGTRAISTLLGILLLLLFLQLVAWVIDMEVFRWLLRNLLSIFAIVLVIIFQPELRRVLSQFGAQFGWILFSGHKNTRQKEAIEEIVNAVTQMSFCRCGALIVFENKIGLAAIINNAVQLNCDINSLLVQSIFYPNSPLHDGAIIVRNGVIVAAHAILPLSQQTNGPSISEPLHKGSVIIHADPRISIERAKRFGTRHRAALGVTEETDAVAIVVSEENGMISAAFHGILSRDLTETELLIYLKDKLLQKKFVPMDDKKTDEVNTEENTDELA